MPTPKETLSRIVDLTQGWGSLRPAKSYSGLTLDQFKEAVKDSHEARAEIVDLEGRLQAAIARRDAADAESLTAVQQVINSIKGDPEDGEDGELYAALGYVRKSARSSGLTRRNGKEKEALTS